MSEKKTIAIQVDDPNFIAQYEERVRQSGKKVKTYLMGLIQFDINNPDQAFSPATTQNVDMAALFDDPEVSAKFQERLDQSGKTQAEYLADLIKANVLQPPQTIQQLPEEVSQTIEETPAQDTSIINMFVKITKEQREALELQKNETNEPVGKILNRLIEDFIDAVRNECLDENFEEIYEYYNGIATECNTTCSAKIPAPSNRELFEYLESTGKSRNVLMACLVQIELDSHQSMEEEQGQGMAMQL